MSDRSSSAITSEARRFLEPSNVTHRQYEALRAYFVEGAKSSEAAERFGYTPGTFRVMCHEFRRNPQKQFFVEPRRDPCVTPKRTKAREEIVAMRKQNLSIYDISEAMAREGMEISPAAVSTILKEEGFARLPRRRDEERPFKPRADAAEVADVREFDLSPRKIHTKYGGLFLFVPTLARIGFDGMMAKAGLPGSSMVPAGCAMRSLLGLKLFGNARHSHAMSCVFDDGLALFAAMNRIPKRSFLTEYSCRIDPSSYPKLMRLWFNAAGRMGEIVAQP
jgi:transposase